MNTESSPEPDANGAPAAPAPSPVATPGADAAMRPATTGSASRLGMVAVGLSLVSLVGSALLWQKLSTIQEQLARQSADSGAQAVEARTLAKQALDGARDNAARLAVQESRLSEVAMQRSQLEELMQSLSRSRDENLVVDIDSALRLAQQQAQLTGSVEPLLAALKTAEQRVTRAAQPRLTPLQRALTRDIDRVRAARVADTPGLLLRLDELVRLVDELPVLNDVTAPASETRQAAPEPAVATTWWRRVLAQVTQEVRGLLRVSRIDTPEAALLSPEQSFFLRENLKLKLLNARLGLLARQQESSRADLESSAAMLKKYFNAGSRRTQAAAALLQEVQNQMKSVELPRIDDTLAALTTAAAGR